MDKPIIPKWLCTVMSYISAFTIGAYVRDTQLGHTPETYQWVLTVGFGLFFLAMSRHSTIKQ